MKKRILSILLLCCMVLGLLPTTVFANNDGTKAIQLGTSGISGYDSTNNSYDYIYFGTWDNSTVKWRVLDTKTNMPNAQEGDGFFLLSDALLGTGEFGGVEFDYTTPYTNDWRGSRAQDWCNGFYNRNLSTTEQKAVFATSKSDDPYIDGYFMSSENILNGTYVINKEQAETVRRIFNLYAEGHGETTVAKMLIEENRKDGGGGLSWTASKVSRVLRKPTYKGYMTYNKSHIDDFLSHNRINHSEEDFVLVKGNFEPIVSEELWETCNQIRSKRAAFVKGKDGRAHKFGVSFPQNKWTKILFCDCGMRFQIEGYDKTANGGKNMRLICARSKMFKKKDAARALNGIPCPAPYASEWKLELMAREVFRTVWKENAEDILGLLRMLDANLNTTGTPNDGNQLENKLSALNEELDDLVSQRASRSITMDDFLSKSTEINNEIINVEGLLQSSIQEQRPKARLDMHSIEAALSDDASFPDGKIEPGFLDRYANRIVKSNNRYIWMLQLMNVQQIMPIQSERQPIAMVTYKSGVPYDIEQEQIGKQDKESAGPDCATICRPQDFFLNMGRTKRKRKLVEWLESCQENQVSVLDEKIPLLSFAVDFVTAYEYQKARGIKIHPGLWRDMRVDIFLVKKEN